MINFLRTKKIFSILFLAVLFLGLPNIVSAQGNYNNMPASVGQGGATSANGSGGQTNPPKSEAIECSFIPGYFSLDACLAVGAYYMLRFTVWVFSLVAVVFNEVILYTLNMSELLSKITIVDIGWAAFRDIINLIFIFLVLYVAINTILGNADYGIKKMMTKIIIAAIFINFSLFFTQAMIDVSNIFALTFYGKITQNQGVNITNINSGISATISHAIGIEKIYDSASSTANINGLNLAASSVFMYSIGSMIFIAITGFVLLAGALMLIVRALTLIFLMVLSPVAFIGGVLPQAKELVGKWWKTLTSNLIFAPVYMAFIYLVIYMVSKNNSSNNLMEVFKDSANYDWNKVVAVIINMIVINILMLGALIIAKSTGDGGTKMAMGWADKIKGAAGAAVGGTAALGYRNTVGRVAAGISTNQNLHMRVAKGGVLGKMAGGILSSSRYASEGFTKKVDEAEKKKLAFSNSLSKEKGFETYDLDANGNKQLVDPNDPSKGHKMKKIDPRSVMLQTNIARGNSRWSSRATRKVAAQAQIDKNKDDIEDLQKERNELNEAKKVADDAIASYRIKNPNANPATDTELERLLKEKETIVGEIEKKNADIKKEIKSRDVKVAKAIIARGGANRLSSKSIKF